MKPNLNLKASLATAALILAFMALAPTAAASPVCITGISDYPPCVDVQGDGVCVSPGNGETDCAGLAGVCQVDPHHIGYDWCIVTFHIGPRGPLSYVCFGWPVLEEEVCV